MERVLRIEGLGKRYGDVVAVEDVSLTVPPGRLVGFVGPNGAGKSTVMRSVFGLVRPDRGEITWNDEPVEGHLDRFGYMPEQRGLYPKMPIQRQVAFFARLKGVGRRTAYSRAAELLSELGLGDRLSDPLENLSHGNQQRVQLAVSLINQPDLLVLDEPFNGLDPVALLTLQEVLEARSRAGTAVLFSSHQLDLVERLCDEVVLISSGRVRRAGTVADVRASAGVHHLTVAVEEPTEPVADVLARHLTSGGAEVMRADGSEAVIRLAGTDVANQAGALFPMLSALGRLTRFDYDLPSLEYVFTELVRSDDPGPALDAAATSEGEAR